jgi:hypothetical protein
MTLPVEGYQLKGISSKAYEHPADRAATASLQSIPYLDRVVRKLIELGYERALRQAFLGSSVRLGEDQLPKVWRSHARAYKTLDLEPVPDLYLTQFPVANASTIGAGRRSSCCSRGSSSCSTRISSTRSSRTRPVTCSPTTSSTARR